MVKVISLSNEAYSKLRALKGDKSFSDVVIHLVEEKKGRKGDLMRFFGVWSKDKKELEKIKKTLEEDRAKAKLKEVKF